MKSMESIQKKIVAFCCMILVGSYAVGQHANDTLDTREVVIPKFVYLTWQGNTSTTMTINYHTDFPTKTSTVYYGEESGIESKGWYSHKTEGYSFRTDTVNKRWVHIVELTNLEPGKTYYFSAGDSIQGLASERKFKTVLEDPSSLKFVVGGDMGFDNIVEQMLISAAKQNPDFVFLGGDIAYADGNINNLNIWDVWFYRWDRYMVTDSGYTIPIVTCIGNHEVKDYFADSPDAAPFYFKFFAQNGTVPNYHRSFGKLISLYVMDTYQVTSLTDTMPTHWLDSIMHANDNDNYAASMAMYHVPLYPAYSEYDNSLSAFLRATWQPIFDRNHLDVAFENHDHVLKCTHPMYNNEINDSGTVYIGDGSWGRGGRDSIPTGREYIRYSDNVLHFWTCIIDTNTIQLEALGTKGLPLYSLAIKL
ncbi:MAG: hypothetical protein ACI8ZM_004290 [Crocinitomix sp.]|jgi:hypothetical protein